MDYPEQARELLQTQVYNRAFFEKLSRDWNITARTPAEQTQLLKIAQHLKAANVQKTEKQASTGNPFLASALAGLEGALREEGLDPNAHDNAVAVKQAAFNLTQDSDIAHAGLALAEYLVAAESGQAN